MPQEIDRTVLQAYVSELELQCNAADFAFERLEEALRERRHPTETSFTSFFYVHAFMAHCANISKLLFGSGCRPDTKVRSAKVRTALDVCDNSPIRSHKIRDSFEHYDERLDRLFQKHTGGMIVDMNLLPPASIKGLPKEAFLRNLDPKTMELCFQEKYLKLRDIRGEVLRLKGIADQWLARYRKAR